MKQLVRSGRMWVGLAVLSWGLGFSNAAWAGHGSSGGSHGSSGGSSGGYYSRGSHGSSGGYHSHGSSGGSGGGYRSQGSPNGGALPANGTMDSQGPGVPSTSTNARSAVLLTIFVPANAKLYIENQPTQLTGTRREFISPRLEPGKEYTYTLKAEVDANGQKISGSEEFPVKAGDHKTVEFGPSALDPDVLVADLR